MFIDINSPRNIKAQFIHRGSSKPATVRRIKVRYVPTINVIVRLANRPAIINLFNPPLLAITYTIYEEIKLAKLPSIQSIRVNCSNPQGEAIQLARKHPIVTPTITGVP